MNFVKDAMFAVHKALSLTDKVDRVGQTLTEIAKEMRDHNDRIIKLETRLDTYVEMAVGQRQISNKKG
jgi:hypothetical protein